MLGNGIRSGSILPFQTRIYDQNGNLRNNGQQSLTPEEILSMDWFCDNVEGSIPDFESLLPDHTETVRVLGVYRDQLLPEAEGGRL